MFLLKHINANLIQFGSVILLNLNFQQCQKHVQALFGNTTMTPIKRVLQSVDTVAAHYQMVTVLKRFGITCV